MKEGRIVEVTQEYSFSESLRSTIAENNAPLQKIFKEAYERHVTKDKLSQLPFEAQPLMEVATMLDSCHALAGEAIIAIRNAAQPTGQSGAARRAGLMSALVSVAAMVIWMDTNDISDEPPLLDAA